MTKCIYCDFNHPDHIGAEIYSQRYIPEKVMDNSEWWSGIWYAYLSKEDDGSVTFNTLHTDNEGYSSDGDYTFIDYCPMCGRRLKDESKSN